MKRLGIQSIAEPRRSPVAQMHGEDLHVKMWDEWCEEFLKTCKMDFLKKGSLLKIMNEKIGCPLHGQKI